VAPQNAVTLSKLSVAPIRVNGGTTATGTVTLTGPAPYGGAIVSIETRRRNMITVPQSVTIPEGSATASFAIDTQPVNGKHDKLVEIVAAYNSISAVATLAVAPSIVADLQPQVVALCAAATIAPCLTRDALASVSTAATIYETHYTLFTPELTLLAETADSVGSTPAVAYEYIWFAAEPLAQIDAAAGELSYYFNDHLGNPILQTNSAARAVWEPQHDPYGSIVSFGRGEAKHQPLRSAGQTSEDGELYQNVFRWYRPTAGRFTQPDPLGVALSEANSYIYVAANPLRFVDPRGLVKITHTFTYRYFNLNLGGLQGMPYGRATASGKCTGCTGKWHIELSLLFDHGYSCAFPYQCRQERYHANIESAFVSRAAQTYARYEHEFYADRSRCEDLAQLYAASLQIYVLDPTLWDEKLQRDFVHAQWDYEFTHHGWCAPGVQCAD
jgi:RHS repeat-associated protein